MIDRHVLNVCFHGIGEPTRPLEPGEARYWISRDQYLSILDSFAGKPNVRVSFDDGNASDHHIGLPGLSERGLTATFFMLAGRVDEAGSLSREQLADLRSAGMRIGTHGMDHRPWDSLDVRGRQREFVEARQVLRELTGAAIDEAALPLGRYNRRLLGQLRDLDYTTVFTSDRRWARSGTWLQPRFSVRTQDTAESLWDVVLARPSIPRRLKLRAVGTIKRLR